MRRALERRNFLCVAGARWRTSVPGGPSAGTAVRTGGGYRALSSAS